MIVGSGGAAFAAAIRARRLGASVAMVERDIVGGTCVNVGCVPSKTLLAAAGAYHQARAHRFSGVATRGEAIDLPALISQKDELIDGLRRTKYLDLASSYGFDILAGEARFADADTLMVDDRSLHGGAYVIATGARPAVPPLPGLPDAGHLTSTTAMEQTRLPERMVVIGGGFVGLEQGQLWSRLGVHVTIVGRIAPRAEPELVARLEAVLRDEGINVVAERAVAVRTGSKAKIVVTDSGEQVATDAILVATGRVAQTDDLDLDAAGVKRDERDFVVVDGEQRTSNPRIFAAGDVTAGHQHVYVAAAQGRVAADNALTGAQGEVDYRGLPSVLFTSPALASAGMTEAEALAAGFICDCRVLALEHVPRALVDHDTRGAIKLVADRATGKILGVHALAAGAGDIILAGVYAIKFGLTVKDLAEAWAPYLTMSEALRLAAQSFTTDVARLSCCAA